MNMEKLWAPWRMRYIESAIDGSNADEGCIFCTKPARDTDEKDLILWRGRFCFVIMNLYPYNNGHLMVVPCRHTADIADLLPEESAELWSTIVRCRDVLKTAMSPDAINIGMNLGRTAGAGIEDHVHVHIVPRWNGDTNFMPVIAGVKVISQSLEEAYRILREGFESLDGEG